MPDAPLEAEFRSGLKGKEGGGVALNAIDGRARGSLQKRNKIATADAQKETPMTTETGKKRVTFYGLLITCVQFGSLRAALPLEVRHFTASDNLWPQNGEAAPAPATLR